MAANGALTVVAPVELPVTTATETIRSPLCDGDRLPAPTVVPEPVAVVEVSRVLTPLHSERLAIVTTAGPLKLMVTVLLPPTDASPYHTSASPIGDDVPVPVAICHVIPPPLTTLTDGPPG